MCKEVFKCFYLTPFENKGTKSEPKFEFAREFDRVYASLRRALRKKANIELISAKEIVRSGVFWERIREEINLAGCVIADITGNNPNVLVEIGVALQANKLMVLISQNDHTRVPSNIKHFHVIKYHTTDSRLQDVAQEIADELNLHHIFLCPACRASQKVLFGIPARVKSCFETQAPELFHYIVDKILMDTDLSLGLGAKGEFDFLSEAYPSILGFLQRECKPIIKAVSVVEGEEHFWPNTWGAEVLGTTHPQSTRIFILQKPEQVSTMLRTFQTHGNSYNVRVTSTANISQNPAHLSLDCILFEEPPKDRPSNKSRQFSPIMVAYYKIVGLQKNVSFSIEKARIDDYLSIYHTLEKESILIQELLGPRLDKDPSDIIKRLFPPRSLSASRRRAIFTRKLAVT